MALFLNSLRTISGAAILSNRKKSTVVGVDIDIVVSVAAGVAAAEDRWLLVVFSLKTAKVCLIVGVTSNKPVVVSVAVAVTIAVVPVVLLLLF